jgi:myo-inositol-1(or 4)-monophosphatase
LIDSSILLPVALEAADLAVDLIRNQAPGALTAKGDRDYASEVDYAVEQKIRAFLRERTPDVGFLGEEEGFTDGGQDQWWALDPIDGTVNFAHDIPLCGVSLGLVRDKQPILGVIDLPFLGARYTAVQGQGAYRDGRRVAVRNVTRLADAVVTIGDYAVGAGAHELNRRQLELTEHLAERALRVRMLGSAAIDLAWLADAKTDATVMFWNHPWDVAAGVVLAREAGAEVIDLGGTDYSTEAVATIAAAPALVAEVRAFANAS